MFDIKFLLIFGFCGLYFFTNAQLAPCSSCNSTSNTNYTNNKYNTSEIFYSPEYNVSWTVVPKICRGTICPSDSTACRVYENTLPDILTLNVTIECIDYATHEVFLTKSTTKLNPFPNMEYNATYLDTFFEYYT